MAGDIERVIPGHTGDFAYAVLDFDGTLSLVREAAGCHDPLFRGRA